jgi:hypothetical protein
MSGQNPPTKEPPRPAAPDQTTGTGPAPQDSTADLSAVPASRSGGRRRGRRGRAEELMVPDATFTSYYGRPVVKASPWTEDIPAYLFLGTCPTGRCCGAPPGWQLSARSA